MTKINVDHHTEQLRYVLDGIHGWNKSVDGKAGFIAGFAVLALGWTIDEAGALVAATGPWWVLIAAFVIGLGGVLAASAVFPVVSLADKPWSALFFQDIADRFGNSKQIGEASEEYGKVLNATYEVTLVEQIVANAIVAKRKFALIKRAAFVTLCGTLLVMALHLFSSIIGQLDSTESAPPEQLDAIEAPGAN